MTRQDAPLAQQAAPPGVVLVAVELDAAEPAAVDVRDAVVLGQALVDERVVRAQQIEHAAVLAHHAVDEHLRLLPEGLAEVVVEVREDAHVRRDRVEVAQVQPLPGEVGHQVARARVGQHPPHLLRQDIRIPEHAPLGQIEPLIVRDAAPQEERQPRRQLQVVEAIGLVRLDAVRILLDAEEELGG